DTLGLGKARSEAPQNLFRLKKGEAAKPAAAPMEGGAVGQPEMKKEKESMEEKDRKGDAEASDKQRDGRSAAGKERLKRLDTAERLFRRGNAAMSLGGLPAAEKEAAQLSRRVDTTMEWAENNYYHLPIQQQVAALVTVSPFWLDYARHDGKGPFLSRHLADASRNFTEMIFALAVLDLPFEAPKHDVVFKDGRMTLTPTGHVVAFHEEVRAVAGAAGQTPILISQNFYRQNERYRDEHGERF